MISRLTGAMSSRARMIRGARSGGGVVVGRLPLDDEAHRQLLLQLVGEALEAGWPDPALELIDRLWSAGLNREDCWYLRGQALYRLRRIEEAGPAAGGGASRVFRSAALLQLLCTCELRLRDLPGAERALRDALALLPDHPILLRRRAELLAQAG